jgi:predicted deacylase
MSSVRSKWVDGNLIFYDAATGGVILSLRPGDTVPGGTQAGAIAELTDGSNGAAVAAAVNGIIAALRAFGIVASE